MFAIVWILCAYRTFLLSAYLLFYNNFFLIIIVITNRHVFKSVNSIAFFGVNFTWLIHSKNKRAWWSWYTFKNILRMLDIHVFYFLELWDLFEIQCTCTRFRSVWFPFLFFRELIMTENTTKVIVYTKHETWQEDYM